MWKDPEALFELIMEQPWARNGPDNEVFLEHLMVWIKEVLLPQFLDQVTHQVDEITKIDPDLSEPEILTQAAGYLVEFLGAISASVRIYDPHTGQMLSYGSFPLDEDSRATFIPLENSVAGAVVKTQQTFLVPNILDEDLYQDKDVIRRKGAYSVMAVPLGIPRFFPYERDTAGVIQIYFPEKNRLFDPIELQMAKFLARRLSFVIARKKILSMHRVNEKKEAIVRKIFLKLGAGHGVKMKEVFNRVIPELADIINIQSCALFAVSENDEYVVLEAGYPDLIGYHGVGKRFAVSSEPAFERILNRQTDMAESPYEVIAQAYLLVVDPQKSAMVSKNVKKFAANRNINSILYVPLNVGAEITHFMTFDALDQRQRYRPEEIQIFLFLGRELMKAQRMERLDDILHDFKNPAIATAGFARRLNRLLEKEDHLKQAATIKKYVGILLDETSRLQEMAMSLYHIGKEQVVNLTDVLKKRFEINREAIREQLKQNVVPTEGPFQKNLLVRCYPLHLERILDNLLNNATNAIPLQGGILAIRTYGKDQWACAEITNTGLISDEERLKLLEGEGRGRGIYITHRIVRLLKGEIEVRVEKNTTTLMVRLPAYRNPN